MSVRVIQRKVKGQELDLDGLDTNQLAEALDMAPEAIQRLMESGPAGMNKLKQTAMSMMQNKDTRRRIERVLKKLGGKGFAKKLVKMGEKKLKKSAENGDVEIKTDTTGKVIDIVPITATNVAHTEGSEKKDVEATKKKKKKNNKKKALAALLGSLDPEAIARGEMPKIDADIAKEISSGFLGQLKNMDKETFSTLNDLGKQAMSDNPEIVQSVASLADDIQKRKATEVPSTEVKKDKKKKKKKKKKAVIASSDVPAPIVNEPATVSTNTE